MTRLFISIVFLVISITYTYSQQRLTEKEILRIAEKHVFLCVVKVRTNSDSLITAHASGFIIDSNYFATCHHLTGNKKDKIISMYVLSNLNKVQNKDVYLDTIYVDLTEVSQFDENPSADFMMLRLKKPINIPNPTFDLQSLKTNDTLYFSGFSKLIDKALKISCKGNFLKYIKLENDSVRYLACLSCADYGFSGSLVYNKYGTVVGLVDSGVDTYNSLSSPFSNPKLFPQLKHNYSIGLRVSFLLESKYLLNNFILPYEKEHSNIK